MTKPVIEKYKATKQEIHKKQEERKNYLMGEIYCHNDTEMKNAESTLKHQSDFLEKLAAQRQSLNE